jgi:hypothetical protein
MAFSRAEDKPGRARVYSCRPASVEDVIPNRFSDEESAGAKRCIGAWFSHAEQNGKGTSLLVPTSFLLNDAPNRFSDEESAERAKCDPYLKKKLRSSFNT